MAAQYISDQIKTRGAKGVVDAADVAFSYKTEGIEQIDKSVKDVIEDLQHNGLNNSANNIIYKEAVGSIPVITVKDKLDSLDNVVSQFPNLTTFKSDIEEIKSDVKSIQNDIEEKVTDEVLDNLTNLNTVADQLKVSFDQDAQYVILSQDSYNNLESSQKENNCLYFIY